MWLVLGLLVGFMVGRAVYKRKTIYEKFAEAIRVDDAGSKEVAKTLKDSGVGMVIMPLSEHDLAREKVLARNKELGIDTPLEDLM